ncbi:MAG: RND transporter [Desulforhopalus sp.]
MMRLINQIPWTVILLLCLTLGLAPFYPQPHLLEKLQFLSTGNLTRPADIFDLFFHGIPFVLLFAKMFLYFAKRHH